MTKAYEQHLYNWNLNWLRHLSLEKTQLKGGKDMIDISNHEQEDDDEDRTTACILFLSKN